MERKSIERYLGRNVEIMLMPDGSEKTSGILLSCEDDHIVIGDELLDYRIILRVRAIDKAAPVTPPPSAPVTAPAPAVIMPVIMSAFTDELKECADDMQKVLDTDAITPDYVRKFRPAKPDKVYVAVDGILSRYNYAVKTHEDKPYSARMQEILSASRMLWKSHNNNINAAQVYAFILNLVGEGAKSAKIYMSVGDFYGAFVASADASSRALAAVCSVVSEPLTVINFSHLMRAGHQQMISALLWVISSVVMNAGQPENYREFCFEHAAALSWKMLGYNAWADKSKLFCQENINSLKTWLEGQEHDGKIIDEALNIASEFRDKVQEIPEQSVDLGKMKFEGEINYFNRNRNKLLGFIECRELQKYNLKLKSEGFIFFHLNQVEDKELRRELLTCKRFKPDIKVTFRLGMNEEGPSAYEVWRAGKSSQAGLLKIDLSSALSEYGEIEFFSRYSTPPFGKVRGKDGKLYTFNAGNVIDPVLSVFLEYTPSVDGHPVKFIRTTNDNDKVQIRNIESAAPFPEEKLRAWEREGLLQRAGIKINEASYDDGGGELTAELEELINRSYIPLEPIHNEDYGKNEQPAEQKKEKSLPVMILEVHALIVRLMKRELVKIFSTTEDMLDEVLRREIPVLDSEEYDNAIRKTRRTYNSDVGLLDILPINVLGNIMGQYWRGYFSAFFGGKSYDMYWKEKFSTLQKVRNALAHAHPEYLSDEDIAEARAIVAELNGWL